MPLRMFTLVRFALLTSWATVCGPVAGLSIGVLLFMLRGDHNEEVVVVPVAKDR